MELYIGIALVIVVVSLVTKIYYMSTKIKNMSEAMDDLGKSRTISSDAIARLEEMEDTIDTVTKGLEELRESIEKNARLARLAVSQVDPLRRNLQELQAALAHANTRRSKGRFKKND